MHDDVVDVKLAQDVYKPPATPPHTGFGSESDTRHSLRSLDVKPPHKDMRKAIENFGRVLRFAAKVSLPAHMLLFSRISRHFAWCKCAILTVAW